VTVGALVQRLVADEALTGATLSKPSRRTGDSYGKVTVRPVRVGGELRYGWTYHYPTRTTSENLLPSETVERLLGLLQDGFRQVLLHATTADYQVLGGKRATILERPATRPRVSLAHDRRKRYVLPEGEAVPFLVELGVMTPQGAVRAKRFDKFRQVNRFLELVDDIVPQLPPSGTTSAQASRTSPSPSTTCSAACTGATWSSSGWTSKRTWSRGAVRWRSGSEARGSASRSATSTDIAA
jgi:hypothetical protein